MQDSLGDRMKMYEAQEASRSFTPNLPIVVRLDGRAFHTFTKGMARPFDQRMSECMHYAAEKLVETTNAAIGYTQSDEITLVFDPLPNMGEMLFGGRVSKLTSVLASIATVNFYKKVNEVFGDAYASKLPTFDCRAWQMPNEDEVVNVLRWREWDATKNSISMAASSVYSNTDLYKKTGSEKQEMLWQKGINWNDYPSWAKRGSYFARRSTTNAFTAEELSALPDLHEARQNPSLTITRSKVVGLDLPPILSVANMPDVVFRSADPALRT